MRPTLDCPYEFSVELRSGSGGSGAPLHHEVITADVGDLIEETFCRGVLADKLPASADLLHCRVRPAWTSAPFASGIVIEIEAEAAGERSAYQQTFAAGRWTRRSLKLLAELRQEGTLGHGDEPLAVLLAREDGGAPAPSLPRLAAPPISEQTIEDCGVRRLGAGRLVPDRAILLNERMVEEVIQRTIEGGPVETGAGVLGKIVKLPEPLPGTETRLVTVLSMALTDTRHAGALNLFTFSPEALAEADHIAQMRGFGEQVISVVHTHGWGTGCDNCNTNERCALAECSLLSLQDYRLLESLFPGKATLLPIAGRKLGAEGRRPVLEVHGWRGGQMRPLAWRSYQD